MAAMATKAALKDLTDADLLRVVANPGVGRQWAKIAKVNYAELKRGNPRSMRSVRVAIMRRHGGFAHSLAHGWELLMDPQDVDDPDVDVLVLHAQMAGYRLGPTGGRAMLLSVSDDNHLPDAHAVRDRLDELLEAVDQGANFDPSDLEDSEDVAVEEIEEAAGAELEDNAESDDIGDDEVADIDLEGLQAEAVGLLDQAPALVGQLRAAADAIEQGTPAAALGEGADSWSEAAQSVLDEAAAAGIKDATALPALVDHLLTLSEERAQHESERRSNALLALKFIELCRQAGRTEMIADQLALHGFSSVEEVEEAAGVQSAPPPTPTDGPEPDTGAAAGARSPTPSTSTVCGWRARPTMQFSRRTWRLIS